VRASGYCTRFVPLKPLALGVLEGIVHVLLLVRVLYHFELLVVGKVAGAQGSNGGRGCLCKNLLVILKIFESDIIAVTHLSKDFSQFLLIA
jgi:hypothetical protein